MGAQATQTAIGPMIIVAADQYEASPLVRDDWARRVLPWGGRIVAESARWAPVRRMLMSATDKRFRGGWSSFLCRKRYIDDQLVAALADGIEAVVILGAGYDTRAYRIPELAHIPVYEVDLPTNVSRKTAALRRAAAGVPANVTLLPVNFETDDLTAALGAAGFDGDRPTFFIWEAVTQYLSESAVRATMEHLAGAAPGSRLVFTYVRKDYLDGREMYGAEPAYRDLVVKRGLWTFGLNPDDVAAFLDEYGWHEIEQVGSLEYGSRYLVPAGRNPTVSPIERAVLAQR
ncbi:SAM-dependent methyltransferase [Mycobacterium sp. TNTM28]|uniref:S-adenosyl-L-methionine-dependent methyltransferase n=1 Tax=[Mycobacterium] fortunisiensis TaxID=2600579 RepID=A0ABS6KJF9_9MYCO|nr:SAM-dependent methyltransferase [[Mycobacterium] fortunisiensis]MBU9763742.1 SAM-dependent methyltransferase [[Mycobacterium] fortunisiensis]